MLSFSILNDVKVKIIKITGWISKNHPFPISLELYEVVELSISTQIVCFEKLALAFPTRFVRKSWSMHMDRTGGEWPYTSSCKRAGYVSKNGVGSEDMLHSWTRLYKVYIIRKRCPKSKFLGGKQLGLIVHFNFFYLLNKTYMRSHFWGLLLLISWILLNFIFLF